MPWPLVALALLLLVPGAYVIADELGWCAVKVLNGFFGPQVFLAATTAVAAVAASVLGKDPGGAAASHFIVAPPVGAGLWCAIGIVRTTADGWSLRRVGTIASAVAIGVGPAIAAWSIEDFEHPGALNLTAVISLLLIGFAIQSAVLAPRRDWYLWTVITVGTSAFAGFRLAIDHWW